MSFRVEVNDDGVCLSEFSGPAHVVLEGINVGGEKATMEVRIYEGGFVLTLARKLADGREQKPLAVGVATTGQLVVVNPSTHFVPDKSCLDIWRTNQPAFENAKTA